VLQKKKFNCRLVPRIQLPGSSAVGTQLLRVKKLLMSWEQRDWLFFLLESIKRSWKSVWF